MSQESRPLLYVSGPLFTEAQRNTQVRFANMGSKLGFDVYLPQEDGLEFASLSSNPHINQTQLSNAIFLLDVSQLLKAHTVLVNCNGAESDSGSIGEATMAYLLNRNVLLFRDDVRTFIGHLPLNPMVLGLRSTPPLVLNTSEQVYFYLSLAIQNQLHPIIPFNPAEILFLGNYLLAHKHDPTLIDIINHLPY